MRKLTLALGALGVLTLVLSVEACSDDVETSDPDPTTTTTGSTGGSGGGTTTPTATGGTGGTTGDPCASVEGTCEQACCKIENVCNFGISVSCDMLNGIYPILECDGSDPTTADCNGQCILDVECDALLTLIGSNWDPALQSCLLGCNSGDCMACAAETDNCQTEFTACVTDQTQVCPGFVQCLSGQGQGGGGVGGGSPCEDPDCLAACQAQFSNTAVDNLVACTCTECTAECAQCGAGGAGTGGAGGN